MNREYWLDIGTSENYLQAHRDIMSRRCAATPFVGHPADTPLVDPRASVDEAANLVGPCYVGAGARIAAGAQIKAQSVICASASVGENATIDGAIIWPEAVVGSDATVCDAIIGRRTRVEPHAAVGPGTVLGDGSVVTSFSKV